MTDSRIDAENEEDAQILWTFVALILVGIVVATLILYFNKLPFPGDVFFAQDKTYPAPTAPVTPVHRPVPKAKPIHRATHPVAPVRPPAATGPASVPVPVQSFAPPATQAPQQPTQPKSPPGQQKPRPVKTHPSIPLPNIPGLPVVPVLPALPGVSLSVPPILGLPPVVGIHIG